MDLLFRKESALITTLVCLVAIGLANTADPFVCPPKETIVPCGCGFNNNYKGIYLDCDAMQLGDENVSDILDVFLSTSGLTPLAIVYFYRNNLTRVPHQLKLFPALQGINLEVNKFTTIEKNTFKYQVSSESFSISLGYNQVTTIAPGSFRVVSEGVHKKDVYSVISVNGNNLTRFESTVFQSVLEDMTYLPQTNVRRVEISKNPIDCSDCHLTWLIRDNRHLLEKIFNGAQCSNGTNLVELDPKGFADCPSFTCPLGYDGYYPDLTNCSNYFVCTNNIADLNSCATGLVYDDQKERCDVAENVEGRCGTLFVCPNPTGSYANIKSCTSYYQCTDSNPILMECSPEFIFNPANSQCDNPANVMTNCGIQQ